MKRLNHKKTTLIVTVLILFTVFLFAALQQSLTIRHYSLTTSKLTENIRIVVITDLHSTMYGDHQTKLIEAIETSKPDLILLSGDIADDRVPHNGTQELLSVIGSQYPCYYVSGNHEVWSKELNVIKEMISAYGVTVLEGTSEIITLHNQSIQICGVDDPDAFRYSQNPDSGSSWTDQFAACASALNNSFYSILLSHRPELVDSYTDSAFDLVVAGHAHGGQVRIPYLLNGLYAPNQGIFPNYAGGKYELGTTTMIVSRGLCKNNLPRVFNPPELVIVDFMAER